MTKSVFSNRYDEFRTLITKARKRSGMTQVEVANKLQKPQSYVSKYERGERRLDIIELLEITRVIGIDPKTLLADIGKTGHQKARKSNG